ncbi:MAG: four helix bundle protein, partial [Planctomycetaceae bacterium]|nr:four helix bundle protein [Planctomycetaceae bacterium]
VWRKSVQYAALIYEITAKFPKHEMYGIVSQLRRASVSISSNIAEGNSRNSKTELCRFIEIAYGSLMETVSQLCISLEQNWIDQPTFDNCTVKAEEIARMLSGLRRSLKNK